MSISRGLVFFWSVLITLRRKYIFLIVLISLCFSSYYSVFSYTVSVNSRNDEFQLYIEETPFFIYGMNWGYIPIGENYSYNLWDEDDAFIKQVLDTEMKQLQLMGVNAIRQFSIVPPYWVTYIYETYGIYTIINHLMGRYGFEVNGYYQSPINYQDPDTRQAIIADVKRIVTLYKDVPGVLFWLLGNENNYGLEWTSFEIEALPTEAQHKQRAVYLYTLFSDVIEAIKSIDQSHPVAISNGDLFYLDLVKKYCPNLDIYGTNVYRGATVGDLFQRVKKTLNVPVVFGEFGSDAFNAKLMKEDPVMQAFYLKSQWRDIYHNVAGQRGSGNALGGFIFQWSDGWWKYLQEEDLDVHNTTASWPNGGYYDYSLGQYNMNEEWWGIAMKTERDDQGFYQSIPRDAYYMLTDIFKLNPYHQPLSSDEIDLHFDAINIYDYHSRYLVLKTHYELSKPRAEVKNVRLFSETNFSKTLDQSDSQYDYTNTAYVTFELNPSDVLSAEVELNFVEHAAQNKLDPIYYENRVSSYNVMTSNDDSEIITIKDPFKLYRYSLHWSTDDVDIFGFYREGHYHWGYEGDFFGLFPEAFYGENLDIYQGEAPYGFLFSGKHRWAGLKVGYGPQLYWGANPMVIAKYATQFFDIDTIFIGKKELGVNQLSTNSFTLSSPQSSAFTAYFKWSQWRHQFEMGVIGSGFEKIGDTYFNVAEQTGSSYADTGYYVYENKIDIDDTLGVKFKLSQQQGRLQYYLQSSYKGLVSDGGVDQTTTFTKWALKDSGRGNQFHILSGFNFMYRDFQFGPNLLYQKPILGAVPEIEGAYYSQTDTYYSTISARNIYDDPFAVLDNRETQAVELMVVYDPTPDTWFWQWNNDIKEQSQFAGSLHFVYKFQPTMTDSFSAYDENNSIIPLTPQPAADVWEIHSRWIANLFSELRMINYSYAARQQSLEGQSRLITRYGSHTTFIWRHLESELFFKFNDWGIYDYYKVWNLTYPLQIQFSVRYGLGRYKLFQKRSCIGIQYYYRILDQYSPTIEDPDFNADEFEISTFVEIVL